jgi:hypothetical protein
VLAGVLVEAFSMRRALCVLLVVVATASVGLLPATANATLSTAESTASTVPGDILTLSRPTGPFPVGQPPCT